MTLKMPMSLESGMGLSRIRLVFKATEKGTALLAE
jgi:hypothetical protein